MGLLGSAVQEQHLREGEGGRIGEKKKLNRDAITTEASADPYGELGGLEDLQLYSTREGGRAFVAPQLDTGCRLLPGEGHCRA